MNIKEFNSVLQVALWKNEGMEEFEIRKRLSDICSEKTIRAGIKLHDYLKSIELNDQHNL